MGSAGGPIRPPVPRGETAGDERDPVSGGSNAPVPRRGTASDEDNPAAAQSAGRSIAPGTSAGAPRPDNPGMRAVTFSVSPSGADADAPDGSSSVAA